MPNEPDVRNSFETLPKTSEGVEIKYYPPGGEEIEIYGTHLACWRCGTMDFKLLWIEGHNHFHAICKTVSCQTTVAQDNCILNSRPASVTKL